MKNWLIQIIIILLVSTGVAIAVNSIRSDGIALVGNWPTRTSSGEGPIIPPSAEEGDPPFITLDDAVAKFQSPGTVFIDARAPEDYEYGRIAKSINIPFDYLDEYWESVIDRLDPNTDYIVYCSGDECEASLFLGRYLGERGFTRISIFYGGWREWLDNGMPYEGISAEDGEGK
jgi:rhodanese-related sulfurtransferase